MRPHRQDSVVTAVGDLMSSSRRGPPLEIWQKKKGAIDETKDSWLFRWFKTEFLYGFIWIIWIIWFYMALYESYGFIRLTCYVFFFLCIWIYVSFATVSQAFIWFLECFIIIDFRLCHTVWLNQQEYHNWCCGKTVVGIESTYWYQVFCLVNRNKHDILQRSHHGRV